MKTGDSVPTAKNKVTSFPVDNLRDSIELVSKIVAARGEVASTQKQISLSTGIGEGTLPLPLSTAVQYGIMENVYGSGYRPTELFTRITTPTFDSDRSDAMFEALSNPALYKRILSDFNNRILPNNSGFANHLKTNYGFKDYAIPKITRAFFDNFAEYIDSNNKLRFIAPIKKEGGVETIEFTQVVDEATTKYLPAAVGNHKQPIPLPGGKMIMLEYPKGQMAEADFEALRAFIDFLALTEGFKK